MITIAGLQVTNSSRAERWHDGGREWSLAEWTNALCGEAGEAANASKKVLRLETSLPNKEAGLSVTDEQTLKLKVANECADTILYAIIIIDKAGFDAEEILRGVFNRKSIEYGFPERI